jgi:predicted chitinase
MIRVRSMASGAARPALPSPPISPAAPAALGAALAPELLKAGIVDTRARLAEALAQTGNETGGYSRFAENMAAA